MKTETWLILGAAAVVAYMLYQRSQAASGAGNFTGGSGPVQGVSGQQPAQQQQGSTNDWLNGLEQQGLSTVGGFLGSGGVTGSISGSAGVDSSGNVTGGISGGVSGDASGSMDY